MKPMTPRERKILALGLLAAAIALAWLLIVAPLLHGFDERRQRRETMLADWRRNERLIASVPALRDAALEQRRSARLYHVTAPSTAAAAAALKQRLGAALTESGGAVTALQEVRTNLPPGSVGAGADAQITLTQLDQSLRRLQDEPPYLVVEYVMVGADRSLQSGRSEPLEVRIEVSALVRVAPAR
ncbi:type II secretion system protein GspM [Caulobacter sp. CCNWLY153]|uniref:type II secretion system protein GspM n=1 Tax=unclassified Caulobacter TaxID=2648921 RepID=UPI002FF10A2A